VAVTHKDHEEDEEDELPGYDPYVSFNPTMQRFYSSVSPEPPAVPHMPAVRSSSMQCCVARAVPLVGLCGWRQ
jgi:hypothetical protein